MVLYRRAACRAGRQTSALESRSPSREVLGRVVTRVHDRCRLPETRPRPGLHEHVLGRSHRRVFVRQWRGLLQLGCPDMPKQGVIRLLQLQLRSLRMVLLRPAVLHLHSLVRSLNSLPECSRCYNRRHQHVLNRTLDNLKDQLQQVSSMQISLFALIL